MFRRGRGYSGSVYGGYSFKRRRQPVAVAPIYENFEPKSELKEEDGAFILLVHLSGFLKEQITVKTDESTGYIRVYGERPLSINNSRIRFNTGYTIPKDCNLNERKIQFSLGILTITIPKIIVKATQNSTDHDLKELEPITSQQGTKPDEALTAANVVDEQTEKNKNIEEGVSDDHPKAASDDQMITQKGNLEQDESPQKASTMDEKIVGQEQSGANTDQKVVEKAEKISEENGKSSQAEEIENVVESSSGIEGEARGETSKESMVANEEKEKEKKYESIDDHVLRREEKSEDKAGRDDDKEKSDKDDTVANGAKDVEDASDSANKTVMEVKEERQLILNVFVATSLIVAIGLHVYNATFGSS